MIKAFISCPMRGRDSKDILKSREEAFNKLKERLKTDDIMLIDSYIPTFDLPASTHPGVDKDVYCMGRSIVKMSEANIVAFAEGWESARGCRIEHNIALDYGLKTILL